MIGKKYNNHLDAIVDKDSLNYQVFASQREFLDKLLAQKEEELITKEIEEEIYRQIEEQITDVLAKGLKL